MRFANMRYSLTAPTPTKYGSQQSHVVVSASSLNQMDSIANEITVVES
jgi:hypothetical protein